MDESDGVSVDVYDGEPIPDACRPFVNVSATAKVFYSPGYPADTYTNNTECVLVLRGK
nr:unnamed protein product [Callosobruchus chinensis]CAI5830285.1 unnamed protein product [Callosobruchus analis]